MPSKKGIASLLMLSAVGCGGLQGRTLEEDHIRSGYEKIMAYSIPGRPSADFEITDVRVGPLRDIAARDLRDFVTLPSVSLVYVEDTPTSASAPSEFLGVGYWAMLSPQSSDFAADLVSGHRVGDTAETLAPGATGEANYAAYRVRMTYEGKRYDYSALAILRLAGQADRPSFYLEPVIGHYSTNRLFHEDRPTFFAPTHSQIAVPVEGPTMPPTMPPTCDLGTGNGNYAGLNVEIFGHKDHKRSTGQGDNADYHRIRWAPNIQTWVQSHQDLANGSANPCLERAYLSNNPVGEKTEGKNTICGQNGINGHKLSSSVNPAEKSVTYAKGVPAPYAAKGAAVFFMNVNSDKEGNVVGFSASCSADGVGGGFGISWTGSPEGCIEAKGAKIEARASTTGPQLSYGQAGNQDGTDGLPYGCGN